MDHIWGLRCMLARNEGTVGICRALVDFMFDYGFWSISFVPRYLVRRFMCLHLDQWYSSAPCAVFLVMKCAGISCCVRNGVGCRLLFRSPQGTNLRF